MDRRESIRLCFEELNIVVSDEVLDKCVELCLIYNFGAEDFCNQWYAFTATNLGGAAPTVELLSRMERKEFNKNVEQSFTKIEHEEFQEATRNHGEFKNAALTPLSKKREKTNNTPTQKTPAIQSIAENDTSFKSSEKFLQRTDSRSVLRYYGSTMATFKREGNINCNIKEAEEHKVPTNLRYMYQILGNQKITMNNIINNLGGDILDENKLTLSEGILIDQMGDMITYGRIVSDAQDKRKINSQSLLLEGSDITNENYTTRLNVSKLTNYSLFPGQVVAVKGSNIKGHLFVANEIYTKAHLELPEEPPITTSSIQIVLAAGPFTFKENLSYEPLHDLLKYVSEHEPHVLILMGPFLEKSHNSIQTGDLNQTFESFFQELIENIMVSIQHLDVQVVIVPNQNEIHHHPVYPTLPYVITEKYNKLTFVSDPGVIEIDGLRIVATTADILLHMSGSELHFDKMSIIKSGRLERMASHILSQRNIYPLYPPHPNLNIDYTLMEQYGILKCKPHILILPSSLKTFIKDIDDCLVINPERLTTGFQAGTFARIEIEPGDTKSICSRAAVQVLRV